MKRRKWRKNDFVKSQNSEAEERGFGEVAESEEEADRVEELPHDGWSSDDDRFSDSIHDWF